MKKLYYGSFANKKREELVNECIGFIKNDLKVVYILPSGKQCFRSGGFLPNGLEYIQLLGNGF